MHPLVVCARRLDFIRETQGVNRGLWVEMLQRFTGGEPGDPWCADFVYFVVTLVYRGQPPIPKTGSCHAIYLECARRGWFVKEPAPGDLFFFLDPTCHAHHVGFVTEGSPLAGIAGNTSPDGQSNEGTGVYEHALSARRMRFARLPEPA